jgi:UrcA family protein
MNRSLLSALGLCAALVSTAPAIAQDQVRVRVYFGDLNLADSAGAAQFKARMDHAITEICGDADPRNIGAATLVKACRESNAPAVERQARTIIAAARAPQPLTLAQADSPR